MMYFNDCFKGLLERCYFGGNVADSTIVRSSNSGMLHLVDSVVRGHRGVFDQCRLADVKGVFEGDLKFDHCVGDNGGDDGELEELPETTQSASLIVLDAVAFVAEEGQPSLKLHGNDIRRYFRKSGHMINTYPRDTIARHIEITENFFYRNAIATNGHAILDLVSLGSVMFADNVFSTNRKLDGSVRYGAMIQFRPGFSDSQVSIERNRFYNERAVEIISVWSSTVVEVDEGGPAPFAVKNNHFLYNIADSVVRHATSTPVVIYDNAFIENHAFMLFLDASKVVMAGCLFVGNRGRDTDGGLIMGRFESFLAYKNMFLRNYVKLEEAEGSKYMGVFALIFYGGIINQLSSIENYWAENYYFKRGVVDVSAGAYSDQASVYYNNFSATVGGAVSANLAQYNSQKCHFYHNSTKGSGGAVSVVQSTSVFHENHFVANGQLSEIPWDKFFAKNKGSFPKSGFVIAPHPLSTYFNAFNFSVIPQSKADVVIPQNARMEAYLTSLAPAFDNLSTNWQVSRDSKYLSTRVLTGGALILVNNSSLEMKNSRVIGNLASGGSFFQSSNCSQAGITIEKTLIYGNKSEPCNEEGSGSYLAKIFLCQTTLSDVTVKSNEASTRTAGFYISAVKMMVKTSYFENQGSSMSGQPVNAFLYMTAGSTLEVEDCTFKSGQGKTGAAVYSNGSDKIRVRRSTFTNCKASNGGALGILNTVEAEVGPDVCFNGNAGVTAAADIVIRNVANLNVHDVRFQRFSKTGSILNRQSELFNMQDLEFIHANHTTAECPEPQLPAQDLIEEMEQYAKEIETIEWRCGASRRILESEDSDNNDESGSESGSDDLRDGTLLTSIFPLADNQDAQGYLYKDVNMDILETTYDGYNRPVYEQLFPPGEKDDGPKSFTEFEEPRIIAKELSAIKISSVGHTEITRSKFFGLAAPNGGAIYADDSLESEYSGKTNLTITHSVFEHCQAVFHGGAIYISEIREVVMTSLKFFSNIAQKGSGGAINYTCSYNSCEFLLSGLEDSKTYFVGNMAKKSGGAIQWNSVEPTIDVTFMEEYKNDSMYGPFKAAVPVRTEYIRKWSSKAGFPEIKSGIKLNDTFSFVILDKYDQVVTSNSYSIGVLKRAENTHSEVQVLNSRKRAHLGKISFDKTEIRGPRDYTASFDMSTNIEKTEIREDNNNNNDSRVLASATETPSQAEDKTIPTYSFDLKIRSCKAGEIFTENKTCYQCGEEGDGESDNQTYTLEAGGSSCSTCPSSVRCWGGNNITPKEGYWRISNAVDRILSCPNERACLAVERNDSDKTGKCLEDEGYTGKLCGNCLRGFTQFSRYYCSSCPPHWLNAFQLLFLVALTIAIVVALVRSSINSASKRKSLVVVCAKILANYFQLVVLASSVQFNWSIGVQTIIRIQDVFASVAEYSSAVNCFLDAEDDARLIYSRLLTNTLMPFVAILFSGLFWILYKKKYSGDPDVSSKFIATLVVYFFLTHSNTTKTAISLLSCSELGDGKTYLNADHSIQCWTTVHTAWALGVAIPCLLIWSIGSPTLALVTLVRHRHHLHEFKTNLRYGFLYKGYQEKQYYWELIILYRKVVIIFVSVFFVSLDKVVQGLVVYLVILISLYVQNRNMPYSHSKLNQMESRSLVVALVTIKCGLFSLSESNSTIASVLLFAIMGLVNIWFLTYWFFKTFEGFTKYVNKNHPKLYRLLERCMKTSSNKVHNDPSVIEAPTPIKEGTTIGTAGTQYTIPRTETESEEPLKAPTLRKMLPRRLKKLDLPVPVANDGDDENLNTSRKLIQE